MNSVRTLEIIYLLAKTYKNIENNKNKVAREADTWHRKPAI
jgi:hypothetical protein